MRPDGTRCAAARGKDSDYCNFHPPEKGDKLRQKGGEANARRYADLMAVGDRWPVGKSWPARKRYLQAKIGELEEGLIAVSIKDRQYLLGMWSNHLQKAMEAEDKVKDANRPITIVVSAMNRPKESE